MRQKAWPEWVRRGGMSVKILVIGAGSIGRRHAENMAHLGCVVDLQGWRGVDLADLAQKISQNDAVIIATATQIRVELIELAAAAGKPVYVEKPLCFTVQELAAIERCAAPVADRSMLGYMMRYHPAFRALADADLSDTFRFDMVIGHDVTQWRQNWTFSSSYAAEPLGGGVLLDLCHELDMAITLFPQLSLGAVDSIGHAAYPNVDMATRVALSAPGLSGSVSMDYLAPRLIRETMICGHNQTHRFDFASQTYARATQGDTRTLPYPLERNAMFMDAARDFLALVQGHAPSDNPNIPRLDRSYASAALVAKAWGARSFNGTTLKEIP